MPPSQPPTSVPPPPPSSSSSSSPPAPPTLYFAYGSNLWLDQMRRRCPSSTYLGIGRLSNNSSSNNTSTSSSTNPNPNPNAHPNRGWRWIINERGFANVVELVDEAGDDDEHEDELDDGDEHEHEEDEVVYGAVYALPRDSGDEAALDAAEGVPRAYGKEWLGLDFWPAAVVGAVGAVGAEGAEGGGVRKREKEMMMEPADVDVGVDVGGGGGGGAPPLLPPPRRVERALVYVDRLRTAEGEPKEEYVGRMNEAVRDAVALGVPREWVDRCVRRFIPAPVA
ncbi:aig2-like protein [Diplodia corticola]|uniref:gamma-glutamylcyclotransferase n=1 Tax=Diplodia corticola TaxID=236234 RepID=A0A1J9QTD0_9PEZI|nr:aig2-like protein [Diplodia corticola]OJD31688.1 aig2-like protein [Diplodia corticola]